MALLRRDDDLRWVNLGARTLVGRYPHCELQLLDRRVSGHHATFLFDGRTWWIRAQQTTNGTFVDDERLRSGERRALRVGSRVRLGPSTQRWHVMGVGPPAVALLPLDGPPHVVEGDRWTTDCGRGVLCRDGARWTWDDGAHVRHVADGDAIGLGDDRLTVSFPTSWRGGSSQTQPTDDERAWLTLEVSQDGERVHRCTLVLADEVHDMSVRRHTHLLLELADARVHGPEDGWVAASLLRRRLGLSPSQLHLHTHRALDQARQAGLPDRCPLIETRGERGARQLRLGIRVEIDPHR